MDKRSIAVLASAVALMSGCGGDEQEESLTRAVLIKRGDAICVKANEQSKKRYDDLMRKNTSRQAAKRSFEEEGIEVGEEVLVPNAEEQAEGLSELPPPDGDEAEIEAIVEAIEAGIAKANSDPGSFYSDEYPFDEANLLMVEYGFKVCGGGNRT